MEQMKRILIGYLTNENGGIDRYIVNTVSIMDKNKYHYDFLTSCDDLKSKPELFDFNSKYYHISTLKHPLRQYKEICKILDTNKYDIAYFNISTALPIVPVLACRNKKIKKVIIHSHSTNVDESNFFINILFLLLHKFNRLFLYKLGTLYVACSKNAGLWMFPKKIVNGSKRFIVLNNAIDSSLYIYNEQRRFELRKNLNISDKLVIGHIGNFNYSKNHGFILDVFNEMHKLNKNSTLLLIGDGMLRNEIEAKISELGLNDSVILTGYRKDIPDLLQVMDIFLLPSKFEGLSIVTIEAQAMGLKCFVSDEVPDEAVISDLVTKLNLKSNAKEWANTILKGCNYDRTSRIDDLIKSGYDLNNYKCILEKTLEVS